jgi:hypothetical protein
MKNQSHTMQSLFLLVSLFIISCKKDSPVNAQTTSSSLPSCHEMVHDSIILPKLLGTWHWAESNGGLFNIHETPMTCNCTRKIVFKDDCTYEFYNNDSLGVTYGYYFSWEKAHGTCGEDSAIAIILYAIKNNYLIQAEFICNLNENELNVDDGGADGLNYTYKR